MSKAYPELLHLVHSLLHTKHSHADDSGTHDTLEAVAWEKPPANQLAVLTCADVVWSTTRSQTVDLKYFKSDAGRDGFEADVESEHALSQRPFLLLDLGSQRCQYAPTSCALSVEQVP